MAILKHCIKCKQLELMALTGTITKEMEKQREGNKKAKQENAGGKRVTMFPWFIEEIEEIIFSGSSQA